MRGLEHQSLISRCTVPSIGSPVGSTRAAAGTLCAVTVWCGAPSRISASRPGGSAVLGTGAVIEIRETRSMRSAGRSASASGRFASKTPSASRCTARRYFYAPR
jgi:hypothetical protein